VDLLVKAFSMAAVILLFSACTDDAEDRNVDTDVINIPMSADDEMDEDKLPKIVFEEREFNTGKITQGEVVNYTYRFTNEGNAPLVISSVQGSCGCTIPRNYPKGKIMPGEGGEIEVEFDSDNKWGEQTVTISVVTNSSPALTQLIIRTNIIVPDNMKTNQ
jgi:hypothetical protein